MSDSGHRTGFFGWHQLLTTQPDEAVAFYRDLLGWQAESGRLEGVAHHILYQGDEPVASVLEIPEDAGEAMPSWQPHLNVDDLDDCLDRVEELGGRVLVEPVEMPELGRLAVIQDPTGAVLTLIASEDDEEDEDDEGDQVPDAVDVDGD